jgi:hypothetical protein
MRLNAVDVLCRLHEGRRNRVDENGILHPALAESGDIARHLAFAAPRSLCSREGSYEALIKITAIKRTFALRSYKAPLSPESAIACAPLGLSRYPAYRRSRQTTRDIRARSQNRS